MKQQTLSFGGHLGYSSVKKSNGKKCMSPEDMRHLSPGDIVDADCPYQGEKAGEGWCIAEVEKVPSAPLVRFNGSMVRFGNQFFVVHSHGSAAVSVPLHCPPHWLRYSLVCR